MNAAETHAHNKSPRYIGNSFGGCIKAIIKGDMPLEHVARNECGTSIPSFEALRKVIDDYSEYTFEGLDKSLILEVAEYFLFRGKFSQCRLDGNSKILKELWTPVSDWNPKDHMDENDYHDQERADEFVSRLNKKLAAQQELLTTKVY